jgi:hypothetical protein
VERGPDGWCEARIEVAASVGPSDSGLTANAGDDRAMFDLAIDRKLRGCDVVEVKIGDLVSGCRVRSRAIVVQQKAGLPYQFELLEASRSGILAWLGAALARLTNSSFRTGSITPIISALGSMLDLLMSG